MKKKHRQNHTDTMNKKQLSLTDNITKKKINFNYFVSAILVILMALHSTMTIAQCSGTACNVVSNSTFTSNLNSWSPAGSWVYDNGHANNVTNDVSNAAISQTISAGLNSGPTAGTVKVTFTLSGWGSTSASGASAVLTLSLNGTNYATFTNPSAAGSNITAVGSSATVSPTTIPFNASVWGLSSAVTVTIPYSGPDAATLKFSLTTVGADHFGIDNVVIERCVNAPVPTVSTLANNCTTQSGVNLTTAQPGNIYGVFYEWHTVASSPTSATKVPDATNVGASGNYYLYAVTPSGCYSSASTPVAVTYTACPDLEVTKTVNKQQRDIDSTVVFTVKAKNNGATMASGVVVNDLLPSGYTYVSNTITVGTYVSGTGVWTIGNMPNGAVETLTLTAKVTASLNYTNTATISGTSTDNIIANNTSSASITPNCTPVTFTNPNPADNAPALTYATVNGINITATGGPNAYYYSNSYWAYVYCDYPQAKPPLFLLGLGVNAPNSDAEQPYTFNLTFDQPVNNLEFILNGTSIAYQAPQQHEYFDLSINGGPMTITQLYGCAQIVSGNRITDNSRQAPAPGNGTEGSARYRISSPTRFTSFTISGNGGAGGSGLELCSASIQPCPTVAAPAIGTITQPTCTTPTGSVVLTGLPATGTWSLVTLPANTITTGTGTSTTISGLAVGTTYSFRVSNADGCTSVASSNVSVSAANCANLTKAASPTTFADGGTTTYTWTFVNPNAGTATGIGFTDALPDFLKVAATPNITISGFSTAPTVTADAGASTVTVSGGAIAAGATAIIKVTITNTPGQLNAACPNPQFTNAGTRITATSGINNNVGAGPCVTVTAACAASSGTLQ